MSFEALQAKVARAEDALEARERQVAADFRVFGGCWRETWSPPRVVIAGLAAGLGIAALLSPTLAWPEALALAVWQGLVPATLALGQSAMLRRFVAHHLFVYVLGRCFLGSALCLFAASTLSQWFGHQLPGVDGDLSLVARWLMAWGDAVVTGMLCAVFVAFKPQWLATWSDDVYLHDKRP